MWLHILLYRRIVSRFDYAWELEFFFFLLFPFEKVLSSLQRRRKVEAMGLPVSIIILLESRERTKGESVKISL